MIDGFLAKNGWSSARQTPLAGDASTRRYLRLHQDGSSAILMIAPVSDAAEQASYSAFRNVGAHLRGLGLSAPEEYGADPDQGLILMEDLGDATLSRLLNDDPHLARQAYEATAAMLPRLAEGTPPSVPCPDITQLVRMPDLTLDLMQAPSPLRERLHEHLAEALQAHASGRPALSLRDVHGDNLIWLADRSGDARIGLLDYQDAVMLPSGYDLASLVDDPRRVVPEDWRAALLTGTDPRRIAALSLLRNLRVLGIFHRLAVEYGKPAYAAFQPRTRYLIKRAVADLPTLADPVSEILDRAEGWTEAAP